MNRRIALIINKAEHEVTKLINELEAKNGYPSHDARHLAENVQKIRLKMIDLGLDPDDTTPQELYHALMVKFEKDSHRFEADLGLLNANFEQVSTSAVKLINANFDIPSHWALKTKIAKQVLRLNPPKRTMKYLGYRSVDSMLKRENIYELFISAQVLESKTWQKAVSKYISDLDLTDFEMRPIKLVALTESKWAYAADLEELGVYDSRIGAAALWPSQSLNSASMMTMILLLIEAFMPDILVKPGVNLVKMNAILWWADMDHLIAEPNNAHVSLNLKDCALNSLFKKSYEERLLDHGRLHFWQTLVNRYQNQPATEAVFDSSVRQKIKGLDLAIPEPAFEFAEEFDG